MADAYDFWAGCLEPDTQAQITRFWTRFTEISDDLEQALLHGAGGLDPVTATAEAIGSLGERGVSWSFERSEQGIDLYLRAMLTHEAVPLVRALIADAPDLPRWTFSDALPPRPTSQAAIEKIGRGIVKDGGLTNIELLQGKFGRIDLKATGDGEAERLIGASGETFLALFGDEIGRGWLGEADAARRGLTARLGRRPDPARWLPEFVAKTQEILQDLSDARPHQPRSDAFTPDAEVTVYEPTPDRDERRLVHDLIRYATPHPDVAQAQFSGGCLSAARFTRFAESFCGIAIARTAEEPFDAPEIRSVLAESLHDLLQRRALGGVTGEGVGLAHIYIDVAVTDPAMAILVVEDALTRAGIAGPAWFLFHEIGLENRHVELSLEPRQG